MSRPVASSDIFSWAFPAGYRPYLESPPPAHLIMVLSRLRRIRQFRGIPAATGTTQRPLVWLKEERRFAIVIAPYLHALRRQ
ncbi:hypothetical protein KCP73_22045 [Salmonella enterica subsp. enterica]|nr:hypothetical protein KCP73_22045 [Salmonella enterica subsp. enterica]